MGNHDIGRMKFGAVPGTPIEGYLFKNWAHGAFITKSATGSSQVTGAGDGTYLYNITDGMVIVDGAVLNIKAAADGACEAVANIMADGSSRVYTIIGWKHPTTGVVTVKSVPGTVATTGSEVAATTAEIEAGLLDGAKFVEIGQITIARTGDTTVTEAQDNSVRPTGVPS